MSPPRGILISSFRVADSTASHAPSQRLGEKMVVVGRDDPVHTEAAILDDSLGGFRPYCFAAPQLLVAARGDSQRSATAGEHHRDTAVPRSAAPITATGTVPDFIERMYTGHSHTHSKSGVCAPGTVADGQSLCGPLFAPTTRAALACSGWRSAASSTLLALVAEVLTIVEDLSRI